MVARKKVISTSQRMKETFDRRGPHKLQRDRILIVCEDSVIAPKYFKDFCAEKRLRINTDVIVRGKECGNDPRSIYNFAKEEIERDIKDKGENEAYDRAYCVFDKDGHDNYNETLTIIQENPIYLGKKIIAAQSIPCFEFWVLLHFEGNARPFKNCDSIGKEIKKKNYISKYNKKEMHNLYPCLKNKTDIAIQNSKKILKALENTATDNPSTQIHILIEDLIQQSVRGST